MRRDNSILKKIKLYCQKTNKVMYANVNANANEPPRQPRNERKRIRIVLSLNFFLSFCSVLFCLFPVVALSLHFMMISVAIGCDSAHFELSESQPKNSSNGNMLSRCLMVIFKPSRPEKKKKKNRKKMKIGS